MTKQQAISLKLAQWLGLREVGTEHRSGLGVVVTFRKDDWRKPIFNPFASSTEGRAQFAECWEKALYSGLEVKFPKGMHYQSQLEMRAAHIEAIYYAIGGTADAWSHSSENASPD